MQTTLAKHPKSIVSWIEAYFQLHVPGRSKNTRLAKKADLGKFMKFYKSHLGHDKISAWVPALTIHFQQKLKKSVSHKTHRPYTAATINRILANLKHFARWAQQYQTFPAGDPLAGIRALPVEAKEREVLDHKTIKLIRRAYRWRQHHCHRQDQNPALEAVVFELLLGSDLRPGEILLLDVWQYDNQALYNVQRQKGRISKKIELHESICHVLDAFLASRQKRHQNDPLFVSRYQKRLSLKDIERICARLVKTALELYPEEISQLKLTPKIVRQTSLK